MCVRFKSALEIAAGTWAKTAWTAFSGATNLPTVWIPYQTANLLTQIVTLTLVSPPLHSRASSLQLLFSPSLVIKRPTDDTEYVKISKSWL